jgi:hypothetical protein
MRKLLFVVILLCCFANLFAWGWSSPVTINTVQVNYPYPESNANYVEIVVTTTGPTYRTAFCPPATGTSYEMQKANQLISCLLASKSSGASVSFFWQVIGTDNGFTGVRIEKQ